MSCELPTDSDEDVILGVLIPLRIDVLLIFFIFKGRLKELTDIMSASYVSDLCRFKLVEDAIEFITSFLSLIAYDYYIFGFDFLLSI